MFTFTGLFGLGETFMSPTMAPLVNSLADERVRGRGKLALGHGQLPRAQRSPPCADAVAC